MDSPDSWNEVDARIDRAFEHDIHLLHRSESNFSILGSTGNVYTVILSTTPSCTCPDFFRPCKHILFVLIQVLGVCAEDDSIRGTTLPQSLVSRLLGTPTQPEALAPENVREAFRASSSEERNKKRPRSEAAVEIPEGTICPVCLDEMEKGDDAVVCEKCKNLLHQECFSQWKRNRGSGVVNSVVFHTQGIQNRVSLEFLFGGQGATGGYAIIPIALSVNDDDEDKTQPALGQPVIAVHSRNTKTTNEANSRDSIADVMKKLEEFSETANGGPLLEFALKLFEKKEHREYFNGIERRDWQLTWLKLKYADSGRTEADESV